MRDDGPKPPLRSQDYSETEDWAGYFTSVLGKGGQQPAWFECLGGCCTPHSDVTPEEHNMRRSAIIAIASIATFASTLPTESVQAQQSNGNGSVSSATAAPVPLIAHRPSGDLDITMDGRIEESVWQDATPISDFTQQEPVEGAQPSERTEIRVLFDEDNLYIGAIIYDDPEGILAFQRERDAGLNTDDRFMWILDTFLDGRTGYFFEINAAGLMGDGVITSGGGGGGGGNRGRGGNRGGGGGTNKAWDGIWEAQTFIRPDGWSA